MDLAASILEGNRLALARALSLIENDTPDGRSVLGKLFPHTGRAHLIGITGAPGTGKSSLVNQLAHSFRLPPVGADPCTVAIVAVDPSSPFSGGALLGDRIRMRDLAGDPGVFIRSMASRGSLGGLAATTSSIVQLFDAAGYDLIMIETVGVGQAEVDIARLAHTTLVVEAPGLGDDIQAIKAGILEIADILVVNKADRPGVENTERALRSMLDLAQKPETAWIPPICRTVATQGAGIADLIAAIRQHRKHLHHSGEWQQRDRTRLRAELELILRETLVSRWRQTITEADFQRAINHLVERRLSPHQAVESLLNGGKP